MRRNFDELWTSLAAIPDVEIAQPPEVLTGIDEAIAHLASDAAIDSIRADAYWPKWSGPWWQMVMLWELGEARRIPRRAVRAMVDALNALPLHIFPIHAEDWPAGLDHGRHSQCHCALGCMDQVLTACGVEVDRELPWIAPWFARYQMADGGLSCDETAYLVTNECPSSMVGTVPGFEAMRHRGPSEFLDRAAKFMIDRELRLGSNTEHNADERDAAPQWMEPAFPRFYFYDVLRGLTSLVRYAELMQRELPIKAIATVVDQLIAIAPDGIVRVGRRPFEGIGTRSLSQTGAWVRREHAGSFPLLEATSQIGDVSAQLTAEWRDTRHTLLSMI
jgi:hypothetical protein